MLIDLIDRLKNEVDIFWGDSDPEHTLFNQIPSVSWSFLKEKKLNREKNVYERFHEAALNCLSEISNNSLQIHSILVQITGSSDPKQVQKLEEEGDNLITKTIKALVIINKNLKDEMKSFENDSKLEVENIQIYRNLFKNLTVALKRKSDDFSAVQKRWKFILEQRKLRQFKLLKNVVNLDEKDFKVMDDEIIEQAMIQRQELNFQVQEQYFMMKLKLEDVLILEESIKELNQLFTDVSILVDYHEGLCENIDENITNAIENVDVTNKNLAKSIKRKKKSQKCWCWISICACCVATTVGGPLIVYFGGIF